uniref:Uncharacterized protein n=1 Tax=uncultured Armatimonadetes bacterium TaxID=157466 RepID=A0A6J4IUX7_9BACT|nr:hypothetical protein AVDCRST_MAG63-2371 [uncultured Armatimonadetes bacterium]
MRRRSHTPSPLRRAAPAIAALTLAALAVPVLYLIAGRQRNRDLDGPDSVYLTPPTPVSNKHAAAPADLLPSAVGNRWLMSVKADDKTSSEEITVVGTRTVGGRVGKVFETRRDGKPMWQEVYQVDKGGVRLLAVGKRAEVSVVPPMPLLNYPPVDGTVLHWRGEFRSGRSAANPAQALSRINGPIRMRTYAGSTRVYKVDTVLTVTAGGRQRQFPSRQWIAPGIGAVAHQSIVENRLVQRELKRFRQTARR